MMQINPLSSHRFGGTMCPVSAYFVSVAEDCNAIFVGGPSVLRI